MPHRKIFRSLAHMPASNSVPWAKNGRIGAEIDRAIPVVSFELIWSIEASCNTEFCVYFPHHFLIGRRVLYSQLANQAKMSLVSTFFIHEWTFLCFHLLHYNHLSILPPISIAVLSAFLNSALSSEIKFHGSNNDFLSYCFLSFGFQI